MWLPTQGQVATAGRYATAVAGTAITLLGLQSKGISLDQVKAVISALGPFVNDLVTLIGVLGTAYAAIKGVNSASPTSQAASVAATGAKVITTPEIAAAVPSTNVTSNTETKVVNK